MSVSAMANVAVARRDDDLGQKDEAGDPAPPTTAAKIAEATGGTARTETTASATLQSIATYIPTEIIGLYLAALAAVRAGINPATEKATSSQANRVGSLNLASNGEVRIAILFAVLTPAIVWLVYAGKVRAGGGSTPLNPRKWPVWEMFAATAGFIAWSFSLPDSPFTRFDWYNLSWATFVVLAVSTGLGLLSPVVQRSLKT
jgi:hypothetical protein